MDEAKQWETEDAARWRSHGHLDWLTKLIRAPRKSVGPPAWEKRRTLRLRRLTRHYPMLARELAEQESEQEGKERTMGDAREKQTPPLVVKRPKGGRPPMGGRHEQPRVRTKPLPPPQSQPPLPRLDQMAAVLRGLRPTVPTWESAPAKGAARCSRRSERKARTGRGDEERLRNGGPPPPGNTPSRQEGGPPSPTSQRGPVRQGHEEHALHLRSQEKTKGLNKEPISTAIKRSNKRYNETHKLGGRNDRRIRVVAVAPLRVHQGKREVLLERRPRKGPAGTGAQGRGRRRTWEWAAVGGKAEPHETDREAGQRELEEETGINAKCDTAWNHISDIEVCTAHHQETCATCKKNTGTFTVKTLTITGWQGTAFPREDSTHDQQLRWVSSETLPQEARKGTMSSSLQASWHKILQHMMRQDSTKNTPQVMTSDTLTPTNERRCCRCELPQTKATCAQCQAHYHINCHSPKLNKQETIQGWECERCQANAPKTKRPERKETAGPKRPDVKGESAHRRGRIPDSTREKWENDRRNAKREAKRRHEKENLRKQQRKIKMTLASGSREGGTETTMAGNVRMHGQLQEYLSSRRKQLREDINAIHAHERNQAEEKRNGEDEDGKQAAPSTTKRQKEKNRRRRRRKIRQQRRTANTDRRDNRPWTGGIKSADKCRNSEENNHKKGGVRREQGKAKQRRGRGGGRRQRKRQMANAEAGKVNNRDNNPMVKEERGKHGKAPPPAPKEKTSHPPHPSYRQHQQQHQWEVLREVANAHGMRIDEQRVNDRTRTREAVITAASSITGLARNILDAHKRLKEDLDMSTEDQQQTRRRAYRSLGITADEREGNHAQGSTLGDMIRELQEMQISEEEKHANDTQQEDEGKTTGKQGPEQSTMEPYAHRGGQWMWDEMGAAVEAIGPRALELPLGLIRKYHVHAKSLARQRANRTSAKRTTGGRHSSQT